LKIQLRSKTGFYFYVIVLDFYYVSIAIKKCTGSLDFICCLYFDKSIHIFSFYTQNWWSLNVVYFGILFLYLPVFFLNKLNFTFHVAASALEFLFHCPRGSWLICCTLYSFQLANMRLLDCFLFLWLSPWKGWGICHFEEVSSISCSCSKFKWLVNCTCFLRWKSTGNFIHANDFLLTFEKLKSFISV